MESCGSFQNESSDKYHATEELESFAKDLINYNTYIVKKFQKDLISLKETVDDNEVLLDFGAGIGTLAEIWRNLESRILPTCLEIDDAQRLAIGEKGFKTAKKLNDLNENVDYVYTSNVLEHIEDDELILKSLHKILNNDGRLAIYVPSFQFLFSELDRKAGHFRRYSKNGLKNKLIKSGYRIEKIEYVDSIGFFAGIALKIFGWQKFGYIGGNKSLKFYDRIVFPISAFLDNVGLNKLFGKNLYCIATKQ